MLADICLTPDTAPRFADIKSAPPAKLKPFMWRAHGGAKLAPHRMKTGHLFNTVRMIWNNSVTADRRVGFIKLYAFGDNYTESYLREAYLNLRAELWTRTVTAAQRSELREMGERLPPKMHIVRRAPIEAFPPDRLANALWMGDDY